MLSLRCLSIGLLSTRFNQLINTNLTRNSIICGRYLSSAHRDKTSITHSNQQQGVPQISLGEKVKETAKDGGYGLVIIGGFAVTGFIFYVIGRELFAKDSPSGVYDEAFKRCKNDGRIQVLLGDRIKGYGETNRRGRRRHVAHQEFYDPEGRVHMVMKFYMEGTQNKATIWVDVVQDANGKYEYQYLIAETEQYPHQTIIIDDNRTKR